MSLHIFSCSFLAHVLKSIQENGKQISVVQQMTKGVPMKSSLLHQQKSRVVVFYIIFSRKHKIQKNKLVAPIVTLQLIFFPLESSHIQRAHSFMCGLGDCFCSYIPPPQRFPRLISNNCMEIYDQVQTLDNEADSWTTLLSLASQLGESREAGSFNWPHQDHRLCKPAVMFLLNGSPWLLVVAKSGNVAAVKEKVLGTISIQTLDKLDKHCKGH